METSQTKHFLSKGLFWRSIQSLSPRSICFSRWHLLYSMTVFFTRFVSITSCLIPNFTHDLNTHFIIQFFSLLFHCTLTNGHRSWISDKTIFGLAWCFFQLIITSLQCRSNPETCGKVSLYSLKCKMLNLASAAYTTVISYCKVFS